MIYLNTLLSDSDSVFLPLDSPPVCPGPSTPAQINLVAVGFIDPNAKSIRFFPGPPRSRITRAQNKLLLNLTKTIKKYHIKGGPLTFKQVLKHPGRDEVLAAWNGPGVELDSLWTVLLSWTLTCLQYLKVTFFHQN